MKIVKNEVAEYLTSNFSEDETAWDQNTTYNYANEARDGHYIYKYAGDDNTNTSDSPSINAASITPSWVKIKPTNYFAMIDGITNTQTENQNSIEVELTCNNFDSISLLEVEALSVELELYDNLSKSIVYQKTIDLQDESNVVDEYSYWFSDIVRTPVLYSDDIPLYSDAVLTVKIDAGTSVAKCGRLVFGRSYYVGDTGYGANITLESYSKKEVDVFGTTTLVHRGAVNLDSYEVHIPTEKVPPLKRKAKELDAIAVLFVMDEDENSNLENLLNYGYWESFSMLIPDKEISTISLTIKGIL